MLEKEKPLQSWTSANNCPWMPSGGSTPTPTRAYSAIFKFQRVMENILHGIPGVTVFIDDILITEETKVH